LFTAQLDLNRVHQTPGGLRRSAFIWLVAARAATLQTQPFSKDLLDQKTLFAVSLCLV
jgi:hypothetical protein